MTLGTGCGEDDELDHGIQDALGPVGPSGGACVRLAKAKPVCRQRRLAGEIAQSGWDSEGDHVQLALAGTRISALYATIRGASRAGREAPRELSVNG